MIDSEAPSRRASLGNVTQQGYHFEPLNRRFSTGGARDQSELLVLCGVVAAGAAIGGVQYGLDYLDGGIERVTTPEATVCLTQSGASEVRTETDVNVTNRRGGDVLQGVLPHGTTDGRVFVAVVDGGEDAPTSGWDDPDPTTRYDTVANTVVAWHDPAPAGLTALVHCLRDEQKDA